MMSLDWGDGERANLGQLIELSLREDHAAHDVTTELTVPRHVRAVARLTGREPGVVAALAAVAATLDAVAAGSHVALHAQDGDRIEPGQVLAVVEGPLHAILRAERTFLNLIGMLSGTASLTRRFVDAAGPACRVLDTRKTWPGARVLQKYAVRCGGGHNHRAHLADAILVKDNHRWAGLDLATVVTEARRRRPDLLLEVEVDDFVQLRIALDLDVPRVLLDNFGPQQVAQAVHLRAQVGASTQLEVSGGVRLDTVGAFAAAGADFVSVGALTHSAPCLDIGLDLDGTAVSRA